MMNFYDILIFLRSNLYKTLKTFFVYSSTLVLEINRHMEGNEDNKNSLSRPVPFLPSSLYYNQCLKVWRSVFCNLEKKQFE